MEVIKGRRSIITASISEAGGVMDLTGFTAKLVIASRPGAEVVASITGSILAPLTGVIIFTLLPDSLIAAEAKHYRIEVNIWKTSDLTIIYTPISDVIDIKDGLDPTPH